MIKSGTKIKYKDYDGKIISGVIKQIGFANKTKSIIWYDVDFGYKRFLVPSEEIIIEQQLNLFA